MLDPEPPIEEREPDGPRCACCGDPLDPSGKDSFCWTREQEDYCLSCTLDEVRDMLTPRRLRRFAEDLGPLFGFVANGVRI